MPTTGMRRPPAPPRQRREAADLHIHTTHSDGSCSPCEVVRAGANLGLSALAITDHDTLSALAIARPEAERLGIELIGGIELTAERDGREIHILGHFVRGDAPELSAASERLRIGREHRIHLMVDRLESLGLHLDLKAVRRTFPRATLGRRHLAEWLTRTGQVASPREAFTRFLRDDGPAQVPKPRLDWTEAIALIRGAGGVAGLAHPPYDLREQTLQEYAAAGLGSIETEGPGINARLGRRWRNWAERFDLVPIAGSDFHVPDRPGRWVGSITTPGPVVELLRERAGCRSGSSPPSP